MARIGTAFRILQEIQVGFVVKVQLDGLRLEREGLAHVDFRKTS
jgi:hypothetical protein